MNAQLVGEVPGRAGKKLAQLERQVQEAQQRHRDLQREAQAVQQEAAELDQELQKLEAAKLAGRPVDAELRKANKVHSAAEKRAAEPWARRLAVAEQAVTLVTQEWSSYIGEHLTALDRALAAQERDTQERLRRTLEELLTRHATLVSIHQRRGKLRQAIGGDTLDLTYPQSYEQVQREVKRLLAA